MLRHVVLLLAFVLIGVQRANADVWVNSYVRQDGTFVRGHWRSDPDGNPHNNWTTYPNVNPYTGEVGTIILTPPRTILTLQDIETSRAMQRIAEEKEKREAAAQREVLRRTHSQMLHERQQDRLNAARAYQLRISGRAKLDSEPLYAPIVDAEQ